MKLTCVNLTSSDKAVILDFIEGQDQLVEFDYINNHSEIENLAYHPKVIILGVEENFSPEEFEKILLTYLNCSIMVVLRGELFEHLLLCQRFNVHQVFLNRVDRAHLELGFIKLKMVSDINNSNIPLGMSRLFSRAIKVKKPLELYTNLKHYFSSFEGVNSFSYVVQGEEIEVIGRKVEDKQLEMVSQNKWPSKYIRAVHSISETSDEELVALPTLVIDGHIEWILVGLEKKIKEDVLNDYFFSYLESVLIYRNNKIKENKLRELAHQDEVTGAFNSRKLMEDLSVQIEKHKLNQEKFCILFIDIDHFKSVNDNYGHLAGSRLLIDLALFLKKQLRESDLVYRYGGDEFVIIMPFLDSGVVHKIATRLLNKVKAHSFKVEGKEDYKMSLSIGISEYPTDALSEKEIVRFADDMMYKSKKSGRGKVFHVNEVLDC